MSDEFEEEEENTSEEYTIEKVQDHFLSTLKRAVQHTYRDGPENTLDKLELLAFCFLCMLDGVQDGVPAFIVAPFPHKDDKQFHIDYGENYYPENHEIIDDIKCDIASDGDLHELYNNYRLADRS